MLQDDSMIYEFSQTEMIDRVLDLIEMSSSSFVYSISGCKQVQQKLNYVFESVRPSLVKIEKKTEIVHDQL